MSRKILAKRKIPKKNALDHIKWCRANLGERGVDWDFYGGINIEVVIFSQQSMVTYVMWHPSTEEISQK